VVIVIPSVAIKVFPECSQDVGKPHEKCGACNSRSLQYFEAEIPVVANPGNRLLPALKPSTLCIACFCKKSVNAVLFMACD